MRAFVVTAPLTGAVLEVPDPVAGPGQVVVDVARAGVCGTDVEFFTGEMAYLRQGLAAYPLRLGHEWCGTVTSIGPEVSPSWQGAFVTGDTMLGCGVCTRCTSGRQHVCATRAEVGILAWPGALADQLLVPASSLHRLPPTLDAATGALVEPGGNALRCVRAAALSPGDRLLVMGPGTIGLLVALIAVAEGAEVHVVGTTRSSVDFARAAGVHGAWTWDTLPPLPFDAVVDASTAPDLPSRAVDLVEPGKRVVYIGLAGTASPLDTRTLALKDVTAVGILSASPGLAGIIDLYASGKVDPRPLVATTITLDEVAQTLAGNRRPSVSTGPKIHVAM